MSERIILQKIKEADVFKPASKSELAKRQKGLPTCPRCHKKYELLYVEQRFCTVITGDFDGEHYDFDLTAGYGNLDEWLANMLSEEGAPKVLGCDKCLK